MPRLSRADMGTAEAGELAVLRVFLERSSLRGLGRVLPMTGDPGSFLMTTLERLASFLELHIGITTLAGGQLCIEKARGSSRVLTRWLGRISLGRQPT